jgi:hypothetical protein
MLDSSIIVQYNNTTFLTPGSRIRDGYKNQDLDPVYIPDHISGSLETIFHGLKNSLMRICIRNLFEPGSGIRNKIPRSETMLLRKFANASPCCPNAVLASPTF